MLRSSISVKGEIVKSAEDKCEGLTCLKAKIDEELDEVDSKLGNVRQIIKDNIQRELNPDGLLICPENSYLKCLDLRRQELDELFAADGAFWVEH